MEQEFTKVVDGVGGKSRDGKMVGPRLAVFDGEVVNVDACKVEEGVLVVGGEFLTCLLVPGLVMHKKRV